MDFHDPKWHWSFRGSADSLETIWKQWHPWRRLMDINIQPCLDLDETVSLFKKEKMNTRMD